MRVVTHVGPDMDAVTAATLLHYYLCDMPPSVLFVPHSNLTEGERMILERADAVVDVGRVYDPDSLRFDHHQLPRSNNCSATRLVANYLNDEGHNVDPIEPLVDLVNYCDMNSRVRDPAATSHLVGLHAVYRALRGQHSTDEGLFSAMSAILYGMIDNLMQEARLRDDAHRYITDRKRRSVVTQGGNRDVTRILLSDPDIDLVVYYEPSKRDGGVGIVTEPTDIDCALLHPILVASARERGETALADDLSSWYVDQQRGFIMIRTNKDSALSEQDISTLHDIIDTCLHRSARLTNAFSRTKGAML